MTSNVPLDAAGPAWMSEPLKIVIWPSTAGELVRIQCELAAMHTEPWTPNGAVRAVAGCWICNPKGREEKGAAGDRCWAAAVLLINGALSASAVIRGEAPAAYQPGLLALREGTLLEEAVLGLPERPEVLLVNATGRDHPRRAGLALHLGAKLSLPTVGVTRQPLLGAGPWPAQERGTAVPLRIGEEVVGCRLCTRSGTLPLAVHPAWRTCLDTAIAVVMATTGRNRTPEPLRQARRAAREARASAEPRGNTSH